jgi:hypothetical protein
MSEPRLIRLVPTGELIKGVEVCEPEEVVGLNEQRIVELWREHQEVIGFARALEREHGIGRRFDA